MKPIPGGGAGQPVLLAVDAGGTSTRAVVLTEHGDCLAMGTAGAGNPISAGVARAGAAIREAVLTALGRSERSAAELRLALVAMAGSGGSADWVAQELAALGVTSPVTVTGDLIAMFCSGTHLLDGVAAVAGTGAAAVRVQDGELARVVDGRGWLLGDVGSGFWLARAALRAVVADLDGRGPATALTSALLDASDYSGPPPRDVATARRALDHLVAVAYDTAPTGIARFTPLVFDTEDPVATEIVERAAAGLARSILTAAEGTTGQPLVLGGSVLFRQPAMAERVCERARAGGWDGPVERVSDGLAGAAVVALRRAGVTVGHAVAERVRASLQRLQS